MHFYSTNKRKIFNDPVHGFISIGDELIYDLIQHPFFQRLRRIAQTGLSYYVYTGATHTRFLHALGCMHLMQMSINVLRDKGVSISEEEERAVLIAILLHDVGHGPFSHALESTILEGVHHEDLSIRLMNELNKEFNGELTLAIDIFLNKYPRKFLHQLISGQIDVDRLDYLKRDSFFSGVAEGNVNSDRIITMFNVCDDQLAIEIKGVYSIEKYLTARMFMYWQVYFHKTSLTAEHYLIEALSRAKQLIKNGEKIPVCSPSLQYFLEREGKGEMSQEDIELFSQLDDSDVMMALKLWSKSEDNALRILSDSVVNRKMPYSRVSSKQVGEETIKRLEKEAEKLYDVKDGKAFVHYNKLQVLPYDIENKPINLLWKGKELVRLNECHNQILTSSLQNKHEMYHFSCPRELEI